MATAEELEGWVRTEMSLSPEAAVDVREAPGNDPRCSDVVTQVEVTAPGEAPYSFHIERPLAELEPMDLVAALAFGGGH